MNAFLISTYLVSIQLVSPASGEPSREPLGIRLDRFPFNWFPQRVGRIRSTALTHRLALAVSIQLVSPASGENR